jgi:hypothetical protein
VYPSHYGATVMCASACRDCQTTGSPSAAAAWCHTPLLPLLPLLLPCAPWRHAGRISCT